MCDISYCGGRKWINQSRAHHTYGKREIALNHGERRYVPLFGVKGRGRVAKIPSRGRPLKGQKMSVDP